MKLLVKFNLLYLLVMALGIGVSGYITRSLLQQHAKEESLDKGRLLIDKANAVRGYTSGQITKLLETQMKYEFLPQSVPSFSAVEVLGALKVRYPEYFYKEATLNPTNPRDRAVGWEVDVVNQFRSDAELRNLSASATRPRARRSMWRGRCASPTRPVCNATAAWKPRPRPWSTAMARPTALAGS